MCKFKVITESGSEYRFEAKDGRILMEADNVVNRHSEAVEGTWEVSVLPWPPLAGMVMLICELVPPTRMKRTSYVKAVIDV